VCLALYLECELGHLVGGKPSFLPTKDFLGAIMKDQICTELGFLGVRQ
jgi:hypothetical protein